MIDRNENRTTPITTVVVFIAFFSLKKYFSGFLRDLLTFYFKHLRASSSICSDLAKDQNRDTEYHYEGPK